MFMEMIDICSESFEAFRGEKIQTAVDDEPAGTHTNHER
jgi:hypothetical protein